VTSRRYATEALVLRTVEFAETSQVVHLATPEHGLVAALAKGAHRPGGEFQGGLALGAIGDAELSARDGAELELLRRFRRRDRLLGLGRDLDRFYSACYVLDLLRTFLRPALANEPLYRAGTTALKALALAPSASLSGWVAWLEARAVAASGLRPRLDACAACGRPVRAPFAFSPAAGGLAHGGCVPAGPRRRLTTAGLEALRRLYTARLPELVAEPLSREAVREVRAIHDVLLPYLLERQPVTLSLLRRG